MAAMQTWSKIALGIIALVVGGYFGYMSETKNPAPPAKIPNVLDPPKVERQAGGGATPNLGVTNQ